VCELRVGRRLRARLTGSPVERAAARLGLTIVRPFDGGVFGAVRVQRPDGEQLVLKASEQVDLVSEWRTGAAMAALVRARGYPAASYVEVGGDDKLVWSLQEILPGRVPETLTEAYADQLISLACSHDIDSGLSREWDALAREAAHRWLADLAPLPGSFDEQLAATLRDTADVTLARTTVVHGDFHHRNCLVIDAEVTGVFDWDIAGAGDWRFDLVCLAFGCSVAGRACEPSALETVSAAVRRECEPAVAAFLMSCQTLRILWMWRARGPAALERASLRLQETLTPWWA
jgi:aminoglycoside phosphotransferase (APT) family kinase protein